MSLDRTNAVSSDKPWMDTAWTILEAANDLGDRATVDACRRVIDASLRGQASAQSDMNALMKFFE